MPSWRCPYCGTPQAESARCWVCHRSTTTCATCRHFRRGIAAGLGMCGLDRKRVTLRGNEVRACWVGAPMSQYPDVPVGSPRRAPMMPAADDGATRVPRTFVPVEDGRSPGSQPSIVPPAAAPDTAPDPGIWSLWGDAEG